MTDKDDKKNVPVAKGGHLGEIMLRQNIISIAQLTEAQIEAARSGRTVPDVISSYQKGDA